MRMRNQDPWCARRSAVAVTRWLGLQDHSLREAAAVLQVRSSTLQGWCASSCASRTRRGRPPVVVSSLDRERVLETLDQSAGRVAVRQLKRIHPEVPCRVLADLKQEDRCVRRRSLCRLNWTRPGTVWAADFTHLSKPVEGLHKVLSVRYLPSGRQLLTWLCAGESAEIVQLALESLFERHGPPLVLKDDNGSGFIALRVQEVLARYGVLALFSPPRTPSYNGACEAGIGALKARAHALAARRGRPGYLLWDDIEAARRLGNQILIPWHGRLCSRDELWQQRARTSDELRRSFRSRYRHHELVVRSRRRIDGRTELARREQASVDRVAIPAALQELELLVIGGRSFSGD